MITFEESINDDDNYFGKDWARAESEIDITIPSKGPSTLLMM